MREQKINKNNPIYTESNFKNIKGDYPILFASRKQSHTVYGKIRIDKNNNLL